MNVFTGCLSWVRQLFNDCCSLCCKESFHFQNIRITASAGSGEFKTPSEYSASLHCCSQKLVGVLCTEVIQF